MITGYFKLKMPFELLEDLSVQLSKAEIDGFEFTKILEDDNSEINIDKLQFAIGGEEINIIKLLFEANIEPVVSIGGVYLVEQIKKIFCERKKANKPTREIDIIYPDGTVIKIKE